MIMPHSFSAGTSVGWSVGSAGSVPAATSAASLQPSLRREDFLDVELAIEDLGMGKHVAKLNEVRLIP